MRYISALALGLGAAFCAPVTAHAAAQMIPTQYPGVFTLPAPPPDFDPLTASAADLDKFGFPPRPNPFGAHRAGYAAWAHAMSAARHYIAPQFRPTGNRLGPVQPAGHAHIGNASVQYSTNWAGQTIENSVGGFSASSFAEVIAQWDVSAVQQAIGTCSGTDVSASWVGLDGIGGSTDVMQAGTEADAKCAGGTTTRDYYLWFEWYPGDQYEITNVPAYPGQPIYVLVHATSATAGIATFVDLESNAYTQVGITPPAGTSLKGDSVEWIEERPANTQNVVGTLADFGTVWMSSEIAYQLNQIGTASFEVAGAPGGSGIGYSLTMLNSAGQTLATPYPQGTSAQELMVEGPAK